MFVVFYYFRKKNVNFFSKIIIEQKIIVEQDYVKLMCIYLQSTPDSIIGGFFQEETVRNIKRKCWCRPRASNQTPQACEVTKTTKLGFKLQ